MGITNKLSCEAGSFSPLLNSHRFLQSEVLRLYFPSLKPWVAWSVSLSRCSSLFICTQIWNHPVCQLMPHPIHQTPPCRESSLPGCPSLPLILVWMNISSLTPSFLDFHKVQFFSQFWLLFVFKFVVLVLVVQGSTVCLSTYDSILARSLNNEFITASGRSV